ncbi:MAG: DUF2798 domain-containing protein [Pseudoalteromonas tetraodonis]|nr:DUF2798 domain-containing protein [Pseudoalteromonas tetraodonis]
MIHPKFYIIVCAFCIAFPTVLFVGPVVHKLTNKLIRA